MYGHFEREVAMQCIHRPSSEGRKNLCEFVTGHRFHEPERFPWARPRTPPRIQWGSAGRTRLVGRQLGHERPRVADQPRFLDREGDLEDLAQRVDRV